MFFGAENCYKATSALTGNTYHADRQGFINVENTRDAKYLKDGGYIEAGGMPKVGKYYECECGWESLIRHCPKCDRDDLVKVEK